MCHKRLQKLFLVVLALALWAGTAQAQPWFTANPTTPVLNYVKGGGASQPGASAVVTITNTDFATAHALTWSGSAILTVSNTADPNCTSGYSVPASGSVVCTVSVTTGTADALATGVCVRNWHSAIG